jgi:hypothetical protein
MDSEKQWDQKMAELPEKWKAFTYEEKLPDEYGDFRELVETYSSIPPDEVEAHLYAIVRFLCASVVVPHTDG